MNSFSIRGLALNGSRKPCISQFNQLIARLWFRDERLLVRAFAEAIPFVELEFEMRDIPKTKDRRTSTVADRPVQYSLALRVVLHFLLFLLVGTVLGLLNQFLLKPFGSVEETLTTFLRQSAPFLIAMICLVPIFIYDTLKLSNRIAGPIYNLRHIIRQYAEGRDDVQPLRFRKEDFWKDLPDSFNQMTDRFSTTTAAEHADSTAQH